MSHPQYLVIASFFQSGGVLVEELEDRNHC